MTTVKAAPYGRKAKPTVTAQLAEAWRVAQDAASTAERQFLTASAVAAHFPDADSGRAVSELLLALHRRQQDEAGARAVYLAHITAKLSNADRPGAVRDLVR